MRYSVEVRVGLFVVATFSLLLFFLFLLGDYRLEKGLTVYADFHFSGALTTGAPVKISGIKIGKVINLEYVAGKRMEPALWNETPEQAIQVRATVEIDKQYQNVLTVNSSFMVSQAGLFGEPYLELMRHEGAPALPGQLYRGRDAMRLDLLLSTVSNMIGDFDLESLDLAAISGLMHDGSSLAQTIQRVLVANEDKLPVILDNANETLTSARKMVEKGNRLLAENGDLNQAIRDIKVVTGKLASDTPVLINEAHDTLAAVKKVEPIIEAIKPEQISRIIDTTEKSMNNLKSGSQDLKDLTSRVKSGEGTVGALFMSQELYDSVKQLVDDIKQHPWKVLWRK